MKWNIFNILLLFTFSNTFGQLKSKLDNIIRDQFPDEAEIGISIIAEDGEIVYSHRGNQNMIPASLQKVITNFAALENLGPNYIFTTEIGFSGFLSEDGTLNGNIIIFGNGDPSLASERFQKRPQLSQIVKDIASFIDKKGITCIDGEVIVDASYYGSDGVIHSWPWEDLGNYYGTSTWSVNIHENYYNLLFQLSESRSNPPKIIGIQPEIPGLILENDLVSGSPGSGDQAYIFGAPYTLKRIVRGSLPQGKGTYKIKGAIPDSPSLLAKNVSLQLISKGINNQGGRAEYKNKYGMTGKIAQIKSPQLKDLVKSANLESINLYCEAFLLAMGHGNKEAGINQIQAFLQTKDIDVADINIEDGSGLSFWNYISPEDFSKLIQQLRNQYGETLNSYFPEAGNSGTLSYLFRNSPARGKLWAKTGSMNQVMNYAGFTTTQNGRKLSFCIMVNRHKSENRVIRAIEERIMETIYLEG